MNACPPPDGRGCDPDRPREHTHKRLRRSVLAAAAAAGLLGVALLSGCSAGSSETPAPSASQAAATSSTTAPAGSTLEAAGDGHPPAAAGADDSAAGPQLEGEVARVVGVVDGDTLRVSVNGTTERLRIIGIDAPELRGNECYAQKSASRMQSLIQSKDVRIVADQTQDDRDRYDRILRHVWTLDGKNVALELVAAGLATEYTYSRPYAGQAEYREAEATALQQGLGLWGACDVPGVVAAPAPSPTAIAPFAPHPAAPDPAEQCVIKGNINREGEKIYHVPSGRSYEDTIINEGNGERWFCTEQEAVEAGWRKAKR